MATKMETLDPSALSDVTSTVTYDPKSETVTLPGGVVSVAGITVMTGGVELSCGSCMLAFGFWGTLIGISCVAVGLWDQVNHFREGTSHLLALGSVILALSLAVVGGVVAFYLLPISSWWYRATQMFFISGRGFEIAVVSCCNCSTIHWTGTHLYLNSDVLFHATHLSKLHIRPFLPVFCVGSFWPCLQQRYYSD